MAYKIKRELLDRETKTLLDEFYKLKIKMGGREYEKIHEDISDSLKKGNFSNAKRLLKIAINSLKRRTN